MLNPIYLSLLSGKPEKKKKDFLDDPAADPMNPMGSGRSLDSLFAETLGRAATNERSQFARQDQATKAKREYDAKEREATTQKQKIKDDLEAKKKETRKKGKVQQGEALIGGLVALLGSAAGSENAVDYYRQFLQGTGNRRAQEAEDAVYDLGTAAERQMRMIDDELGIKQQEAQYKLEDLNKFQGRAEMYDGAFKKADAKVKQDKEAKVDMKLQNIGKALGSAKNQEEADRWMSEYDKVATSSGREPLDEATRFIVKESLNQKMAEQAFATKQEQDIVNDTFDKVIKVLDMYDGAPIPPDVASSLDSIINETNLRFAGKGLRLPNINTKATPKWLMETEKELRAKKMWGVDLENKKLEGLQKKKNLRKADEEIKVLQQKVAEGKGTAADRAMLNFLTGEPISPALAKTAKADFALKIKKNLETAGGTMDRYTTPATENLVKAFEDMTAMFGPKDPDVVQMFYRLKTAGKLPNTYGTLDAEGFADYWLSAKDKANALQELFPKKKDSGMKAESINGYQVVERGKAKVVRTGNGMEYPLNVPYVWGGSSSKGADCSGIVCLSMTKSGVKVPRTTAAGLYKSKDFMDISGDRGLWNPDDLLFFDTSSTHGEGGIDHVAVYLGNGKMFHSPSKGKPSQIVSVDAYLKSGAKLRGTRRHKELR